MSLLEGIKDVLCHRFGRLTIGQNCNTVCANKGGHRDAFSNKLCKAPYVLRGLLSRPRSLKQSKRQALLFVVPINNLVVDSMFKQLQW